MASTELTEYERRRLENIKRNGDMIASLNIHSTLSDLSSAASKRPRPNSLKLNTEKKQKSESTFLTRRSLRALGIAPESKGLKYKTWKSPSKYQPSTWKSITRLSLLSTEDAYCGSGSDEKLYETIMGFSNKSQTEWVDVKNEQVEFGNVKNEEVEVNDVKNEVFSGSIDLNSMKLEPDNIAQVVPGRIMALKFFPIKDKRMVVVGNKRGKVGFWNVDARNEEGDTDGIYVYKSHSGPISGISIQPFSVSKIITSSCDGLIRLMDVERETYNLAYSTTNGIYSVSYRPNDAKSLYFGEGTGKLGIWDERSGKCSLSRVLHGQMLNSIDFSSGNTNLMATSSADGTARIWDLRNIDATKPISLKVVRHSKPVHSAYFSPSGSLLASTSFDNKIGVASGANYDDVSMIFHNNHTGRCISPFRTVWGWDDSYLFVGSMLTRGINVISAAVKKEIATLKSQHMSATLSSIDAHPFNVGVLAGATKKGAVCIWSI